MLDSNIRKRAYTCTSCEGSHDRESLNEDSYVLSVTVHADEESMMLMLASDVASKAFPGISDPQEVADELLFIVGKKIKYNPRSNFIVTIS